MSDFVNKAAEKLEKMSDEQIKALIARQSERLRLREGLLDSVDSGILVLDGSQRISFCNSFLGDIFGFNHVKAMKSRILVEKIISDGDVLDFIRSNAVSPRPEPFDFDHSSAFFGQMRIRLSAAPLKGLGVQFFRFTDITLFEKMKYEFKKNESLAQMTTVAATVAHEIKNPLASISIYLQLLEKRLDKDGSITREAAEKSLSVISSEIERLNNIAVDFLFAVKPLDVKPRLSDLNALVEKTADLCRAEVEEAGCVLRLDLASSLPRLEIDPALIEQCLLNLVRNAVQAMEPGSPVRGSITIGSFQDGNEVKMTVSDTGCGMKSEVMEKIFEPYFTTKASGSGLGLTTIFKIMKRHDGDVSVTSEPGRGSVFTLSFPVPQSERRRLQSSGS